MENYATKEQMKIEAIRRLNELKIYKPYINAFKAKKQRVTMFEGPAIGYYATKENGWSNVENFIKKYEEKHNCIIYAVTHERTEFGELYDYYFVSAYIDDWKYELQKQVDTYYVAMCYCQNVTNDNFSEIDSVGIISLFGGMYRVS